MKIKYGASLLHQKLREYVVTFLIKVTLVNVKIGDFQISPKTKI